MNNPVTLPEGVLKVYEKVPDCYLILSSELRILTASDAYLEATHTQRETIVDKHIFDVFPKKTSASAKNEQDELFASLHQVLKSQKPHHLPRHRYDLVNPSQGPVERYWHISNTPIVAGGTVLYIIQKVEDITQQVTAQQRHQENEALVHSTETVANIGSYEMDLVANRFHFSDGMYRLFGEVPGSLMPSLDWIDSLSHPDDRMPVRNILEQAAADQKPYYYTRRIYRKDGEMRLLEAYGKVIGDVQGQAIKFIGLVQDITERKRDELQLKQKQELLEATMNSSLDMIQVFEAVRDEKGEIIDFRYVLLNHEAEKRMGDAVGKSLLQQQPGVLEEGIFAAFKQVVQTGLPNLSERHYVHEQFDGWFYQSVVKLDDGVVTTTADITARKKAELEINTSRAFLQSVIDSSLDLIQVFKAVRNQTGAIVDFTWLVNNQKAIEQNGEVIGKSLRQQNPGVVQAGIFDRMVQVTETGVPQEQEQYYNSEQFTDGWFYHAIVKQDDGIAMTTRNITVQKKAEAEVLRLKDELAKKATDKYNELFNSIDQGFCTIKVKYDENDKPVDYQFLEVSPSFEFQTGIKNGVGKWMRDLAPDQDEFWFETYGRVAKDRKSERFESFSTPLGRWWSVYAFPVGTPESRELGVLFYDITEKKKTEEALRKNEETFRTFVTASANIVYKMSGDWKQMQFLYGQDFLTSTESSTGSWLENYIPAPEKQRVSQAIEEAIRGKKIFELEHQVYDQYGNMAWAYSRAIPLLDNQGNIVEWMGAATDVTQRKQAEEALRKSEEKYRSLFNSIDEGYNTVEVIFENGKPVDCIVLEINPAYEKMAGLKREAVVGKYLTEFVPDVEKELIEQFGQVVRTGEPARFEHYIATLDRWLDLYVSRVEGEGSRLITIVFNNITERKRRERSLAFLAEISQDLVRLTSIGETMTTLGARIGGHLNVSRCAFVKINEAADEAVCEYDWHRADSSSLVGIYRITEFYTEDFLRILRTGAPFVTKDIDADWRVDAKNLAALQIASLIVIPIVRAAQLQFALCIYDSEARDWRDDEVELMHELTTRIWTRLERVRAEEALRQSEERLQKALSIETVGVIYFSLAGGIHDANAAFERMSGFSKEALVSGKVRWEELTAPEFREITLNTRREYKEKGQNTPYEKQYIRPDGTRWWGLFAGKRLSENEYVEFVLDITKQKQAEKKLKQFNESLERQVTERTQALEASRDLLQSVFDTTLISLSVLKAIRNEKGEITDFRIVLINKELEQETGRTDLAGKLYSIEYPGIKQAGLFDLMLRVIETGEPGQVEYYYPHEGFSKWYSAMFVKMDDGLVASNLDITERKLAEAELARNFAILKQAEEVAGMGSWEFDYTTGSFHWSEGMYHLFGLPVGSEKSPEIYLDYVIEEDRSVAEKLVHIIKNNPQLLEETLRIGVNGQIITLKVKAIVLRDDLDRPYKMMGVDLDVSEVKRLEQENLQMRLDQQKVLILAILQAQEEERRRISESLHNGVGQILYATKLNLDQLAQQVPKEVILPTANLLSNAIAETRRVSHELVPVILNDFGLEKAIVDLCRQYHHSTIKVNCEIDMEERLEPYLEIAIYRISQELLNNVAKHAQATKADILLVHEEGEITLKVRDNGQGMGQALGNKKGIGLRTISDRVKLLSGTFTVDKPKTGKGTQIMVKIPIIYINYTKSH